MDTLKPVVIDTRRDELTSEASHITAAEGIKAVCIIPLVKSWSCSRTPVDFPHDRGSVYAGRC
jgi:hypothetical protein